MAIPDFIKSLRAKIGTDLLQIPTVGVLAYDEGGRLLLIQDKSSGLWGLPGGIIDPHELPSDAAVRETWEEAGVLVELTRLLGVFAGEHFAGVYENGDQVACVATIFVARAMRGSPRPDGVETADARFVHPEELVGLPCQPHFRVIQNTAGHPRRDAFFASATWKPTNS